LANAAGPDSAADDERDPLVYRTVTFPPTSLPPHAGQFEARFHRNNSYKVECRHPFVIVQGPLLRWRRIFLCVLLIGFTWALQNVLNAKGTCDWKDPTAHADAIDDLMYRMTAPLNAYLYRNMWAAELIQAACSLALDALIVLFSVLGATRRSSTRPFMALFTFLAFRFSAQVSANIPCPPGFIWPRGAVSGVAIPSLFVDYHPANDFFFSGHVGIVVVLGLEFVNLDYIWTGLMCILVLAPSVAVWVVSLRVHRGIDVIAAIYAAIAASCVAERVAAPFDAIIIQQLDEVALNELARATRTHIYTAKRWQLYRPPPKHAVALKQSDEARHEYKGRARLKQQ
jgi:hypothetical protein